MAYKFQLGSFVASGSIKAESGFDAADQDIDNVGTINVDVIGADGTEIDIALADNQAAALEIKEGSNVYQKFVTSNGSEKVEFMKPVDFGNQAMTNVNIDSGAIELAALDIDGGSDIGADLADADLLVVDDGAGGTNRKSALSRMKKYIYSAISGDATASDSGALTIADGAVESDMLNDNIISGQDALGGATVAQADLLLIDDGPGTVKKVTFSNFEDSIFGNVSGDIAIAAGGAATIQANAVEGSMLNDNTISGLDDIGADLQVTDELMVSDAGTLKRMDLSRLSTMMQSTGLADSSGQLSVAAAQTTITSIINSSLGKIGTAANQEYIDFGTANEIKLSVNNNVVASAEDGVFVVAGDLRVNGTTTSINSTTVNVSSSFTFEGPADDHETTLHAGGDGTGAAPQADTNLYLPALTAGNYFIPALADQASQASAAVTAAEFALLDGGSTVGTDSLASGDGFLHNDGGTMKQTSVDKIADFFAGDGLASSSGVMALSIAGLANELSSATVADSDEFAISDGGTMKKIDFQHVRDSVFADVSGDAAIAAGGALTIQADAVEAGMLNDNVISGQTEMTATLVNTDELMISDGGTLKRADLSLFKTYIGNGTSAVALKDDSDTLAVGVNYFGTHGGAESVSLPASAGLTVGESIKIKAGPDCSSTNSLTINKAGSQTIDGATSIVLESPFAAVELVYVAADTFRVF